MKKLVVFASVLAMASLCLVFVPTLRAQDSGTLSIKDPAEFNAYQMATTQSDPKAKAAALESFLATYPQSQAKQLVIDMLVDLYETAPPQGAADPAKELVADDKMLQLDPNNLKALLYSVIVKKQMGSGKNDVATLDDAAARAHKGLTVPKPASIADDEWKRLTGAAYPLFHSAIATDDVAKKDFRGAIDEYRAELMLYTADQTQSGPGLSDTLYLAEAYVNVNPKKPDPKDLINAVWFYCRAWDYAPANFKPLIEKKVEYWYKSYHGNLDGLDAIKTQAQATEFPPGTLDIKAAATPAERIHALMIDPSTNLPGLALADKETVLAVGSKEDADKLWAIMKDQQTPIPGTVIESSATTIKVAVTDDAKQAKTADFVVTMKTPLADKEIPAVGSDLKLLKDGGPELDGTYDTYTQTPATDTTPASAQIMLRDAILQTKKAPVHKPAAAHHAAAH
jgi:hypothetical protein